MTRQPDRTKRPRREAPLNGHPSGRKIGGGVAGVVALVIAVALGVAHSPSAHAAVPGEPLGLEECERLALERNPDLAGARQRILAAREEIDMVKSAYYPSLRIGASYAATNNPAAAFTMILNQRQLSLMSDFNNPATTDNINTRLLLNWSLYDARGRSRRRDAAQAGEQGRQAQASAIRNEMIFQVHRGFYGILQARELVRIQTASVGSLERSLQTAQQRLAAGTVVKTDVLNLEVRLAEARETLARATNREALARSALANLIGDPGLRDAEFRDEPPTSGGRDPGTEGDAVAVRPERRAAQAEVERLQAEAERARGGWLPSVELVSHIDLDGERFNDMEDSWVAAVSVQWDLFEGNRRGADIRRADSELARAREAARRVELDLEHELQKATLALREAAERVAVTGKSVELATESLKVTRQRYENGAVDIVELLAAEVALTTARALAATAIYDQEIARAGIARATGQFASPEPEG
jgi:outer membrane protein TolC